MSFAIPQGAKVKEKITGLTGIVVARTEWMHGCNRYVIQPQELKDGKPVDTFVGDENQFEILAEPLPEYFAAPTEKGRTPHPAGGRDDGQALRR